MSPKLRIKRALAGVGRPIKLSVCRSSILNFASLYAEPKVIIKPIKTTQLVSVEKKVR